MKLTERQKTLVRLINSSRFPVEICEKYWKEDPQALAGRTGMYSFCLDQVKQVNAFMEGVAALSRILEERANPEPPKTA